MLPEAAGRGQHWPRPQFFTIRSSQPANNIYIFTTRDKIWILVKGKILYFTVYIINWFIYRGSNTSHLSRTRKRNSKNYKNFKCFIKHLNLEREEWLQRLTKTLTKHAQGEKVLKRWTAQTSTVYLFNITNIFNNKNARVRLFSHLIATLSFMPHAGQSSGNCQK